MSSPPDMVVNSSSNESFDHLHLSTNNTSHSWYIDCFISSTSIFLIIFNIVNILLLLPLCSFIIYLGLQQWRQQRSSTISHSDSFTYHMVAIELVGVVGSSISLYGIHGGLFHMIPFGSHLLSFTWFGQMFFHTLTCVERYLAVAHPITYLSLRKARGIRMRNITNVCVWPLSIIMVYAFLSINAYWNVVVLLAIIVIIIFCNLSALWVLTRPGPGGDRSRVDQSKQRAFYIITVILGVLLVKIAGSMIWVLPFMFTESINCFTVVCAVWFNLPSTLLLPLLFLQRSGKLVCCKKNI